MASVIILATLMNAVLIMVTVVEGMKRRRRPYGCVCAGAGPFVVNQMSMAMSCVGITQPIRFTPSRARTRGGARAGGIIAGVIVICFVICFVKLRRRKSRESVQVLQQPGQDLQTVSPGAGKSGDHGVRILPS